MQAHLLQIQKNRVGAIERAESPFGKTPRRMSRRFERVWIAEFVLLFSAAFENAQNISGLTQSEAGQGIDEGKNAVFLRHLRRHRNWAFEAQPTPTPPVGLAEAIIFIRIPAVVVERRAPKHRPMAHHR